MSPILNSIPRERRGWGSVVSKWAVSHLGESWWGTLNWGVLFLNHDNWLYYTLNKCMNTNDSREKWNKQKFMVTLSCPAWSPLCAIVDTIVVNYYFIGKLSMKAFPLPQKFQGQMEIVAWSKVVRPSTYATVILLHRQMFYVAMYKQIPAPPSVCLPAKAEDSKSLTYINFTPLLSW